MVLTGPTITAMSADDDLVLQFIPPLVTILLNAERTKGSPLTEVEVLEIRDSSACVRLPRSAAEAMIQQRGYSDLDPDRCWQQWQDVRAQLAT